MRLFQFQYGTIKRAVSIGESIGLLNFNSSMVRLKVKGAIADLAVSIFQFQYGTIKRYDHILYSELAMHFNSSMVRLKV